MMIVTVLFRFIDFTDVWFFVWDLGNSGGITTILIPAPRSAAVKGVTNI